MTQSEYYDGRTGKLMRMSDLAQLNLNETDRNNNRITSGSILHNDYKNIKLGDRS